MINQQKVGGFYFRIYFWGVGDLVRNKLGERGEMFRGDSIYEEIYKRMEGMQRKLEI